MAKVSNFMIGILLISCSIAIITLFIGNTAIEYNVDKSELQLDTYNKITSMTNLSNEIKSETDSITQPSGLLDVIGAYFSSGWKALKLTAKSFDVFMDLNDQGFKDLDLGEYGEIIRMTILTIVIIILFVGVFISAILKWWV